MSQRAWINGVLLGLLAWALIAWGIQSAIAAPLSDTPRFLARYGLIANDVPVLVVPPSELRSAADGQSIDGESHQDRILLNRKAVGIGGVYLARLSLHEWIHQVSMWGWSDEEYGAHWVLGEEWQDIYEEGLVEAAALDLLPNYWRWLTGKRMSAVVWPAYSAHAVSWRVWSARATGKPWRSRAAREWRAEALTWGPAKRMDAIRELEE